MFVPKSKRADVTDNKLSIDIPNKIVEPVKEEFPSLGSNRSPIILKPTNNDTPGLVTPKIEPPKLDTPKLDTPKHCWASKPLSVVSDAGVYTKKVIKYRIKSKSAEELALDKKLKQISLNRENDEDSESNSSEEEEEINELNTDIRIDKKVDMKKFHDSELEYV